MHLKAFHAAQGAVVADDGIPLHYTSLDVEYRAALSACVLLDRSHEGRVFVRGGDRAEIVARISTNDLRAMAHGQGRPTIFTNANARILERAVVFDLRAGLFGDALLLLGGPGRGPALTDHLRRSIFFRDAASVEEVTAQTAQFDLHGPTADAIAEALAPGAGALPPMHGVDAELAGGPIFVARREPYSGAHWTAIAPAQRAAEVWAAIMTAGAPHGLIAAGSLTFNTLRIRAGLPGVGRELTPDYIPLEIGLWDEVSFSKGCYTGQEIIARMESRGKLARVFVALDLPTARDAPAELRDADGRPAGTLTSCTTAPDGQVFALAVVKSPLAQPGTALFAGPSRAVVARILGSQPALEVQG
jgi:aminomethyltransferase